MGLSSLAPLALSDTGAGQACSGGQLPLARAGVRKGGASKEEGRSVGPQGSLLPGSQAESYWMGGDGELKSGGQGAEKAGGALGSSSPCPKGRGLLQPCVFGEEGSLGF